MFACVPNCGVENAHGARGVSGFARVWVDKEGARRLTAGAQGGRTQVMLNEPSKEEPSPSDSSAGAKENVRVVIAARGPTEEARVAGIRAYVATSSVSRESVEGEAKLDVPRIGRET